MSEFALKRLAFVLTVISLSFMAVALALALHHNSIPIHQKILWA